MDLTIFCQGCFYQRRLDCRLRRFFEINQAPPRKAVMMTVFQWGSFFHRLASESRSELVIRLEPAALRAHRILSPLRLRDSAKARKQMWSTRYRASYCLAIECAGFWVFWGMRSIPETNGSYNPLFPNKISQSLVLAFAKNAKLLGFTSGTGHRTFRRIFWKKEVHRRSIATY